MKDSAKFLNFNPNRRLMFDPFRRASINSQRRLLFDSNRDLNFDLNRDLGFGKRGVVFRGYVCPICGAPVGKFDPQCDECGVKFEQTRTEAKKESEWQRGKKVSVPANNGKRQSSKKSGRQKGRQTFECPVCGKLLYVGTSTCPGCGIDFDVSDKGREERASPPRRAPKTGSICDSCGYQMPEGDKFCRRCGARKPKTSDRTTVSWDEYQSKRHEDGIISWEDYAKKG